MMRAGKLRTRIEVQQRTLTRNAYGEQTETDWTTIGRRYAWIRPLQTAEIFGSGQMRAIATHEIIMRYWDSVTHQHRLKDGSRIYNILQVLDVDNRTREMKLICREEQS